MLGLCDVLFWSFQISGQVYYLRCDCIRRGGVVEAIWAVDDDVSREVELSIGEAQGKRAARMSSRSSRQDMTSAITSLDFTSRTPHNISHWLRRPQTQR